MDSKTVAKGLLTKARILLLVNLRQTTGTMREGSMAFIIELSDGSRQMVHHGYGKHCQMQFVYGRERSSHRLLNSDTT